MAPQDGPPKVESAHVQRIDDEQFLRLSPSQLQSPADMETMQTQPTSDRRMNRIALCLALITAVSTFFTGVAAWVPQALTAESQLVGTMLPFRQALLANWADGLQFALGLMAILAAHELGHYVMTLIYRVPSTPPLFIPLPYFSPFGTMGAVIMMQSGRADRRQIFDIGIAGPLAGLVVAIPLIIYGLMHPHGIAYAPEGVIRMGQPLLIQWLAAWITPETAGHFLMIDNDQATPLLMAGWGGLLVTGINMMPLGQLDGGHVTFGLVGDKSIHIARATLAAAVAFMLYQQVIVFSLMLVLVVLMGLRHPPSSDDSRSLGWRRQVLGWASLSLPLLCVPANPIVLVG
ncbi:MAG: site-2 protease family protein [Pirellulaceae bacterium]|nr:site-2 protease family protein [Pirellulaceae bacterium]